MTKGHAARKRNRSAAAIEWVEADSEALSRFAYDAQSEILTIVFTSGGTYNYFDVPEFVFDGLLNAPSKGHYVSEKIRDIYQYVRLDRDSDSSNHRR